MWEDTRWPASLRASNSSALRMRCRGRKKSRFVSGIKPLIRGSNACARFFGDWPIWLVRCGSNSGFGTRAVVFVESSTVGMFASFLNFLSIWPTIFEFCFGNPLTQSSSPRLFQALSQRKREKRITTNEMLSRPRLKICSAGTGFCICPGVCNESTQRQEFGAVLPAWKTNRKDRLRKKPGEGKADFFRL